jgi:DNA polymerase III delta prime subunit
MESNPKHYIWVEKYRPSKIKDVILPKALKEQFEYMVGQGELPNLLLSGGAGIGKTTIAKAMLDEIDADVMFINASNQRGIDAIRTDIMGYASTVSFSGGRKYVILDEADNLTADAQKSLRSFMEEYAKNCGFILTCNYLNKIIPALHSRCSVVTFTISKKDAPKLAGQFFKRTCEILDAEKVSYEPKAVAALVQRYYPDWRRTINELQRLASTGTIDSGSLGGSDADISSLVELMKDKQYTEMRHWVRDNLDSDPSALMRAFYDASLQYVPPSHVPSLVLLVAKYQYQAAFAADPEINIMAFLAEVMIEVEFK